MVFLVSTDQARLEMYCDAIGVALGNESRRGSFACTRWGCSVMESERASSPSPLAAALIRRASTLFTNGSCTSSNAIWGDADVWRIAANHALEAMEEREPMVARIVDDTGFLKQGKHSVGVQHHYTGSAVKITNCQIGASLVAVTETEQVPIDFELYLPRGWLDDPKRRAEARIPDELDFKTKPELALDMVPPVSA